MNVSQSASTVTMKGGVNFTAIALINSLDGTIQVGNISAGATDILVGNTMSKASSSIIAVTDDITINTSNDMNMQAGDEDNVLALVQNTSGNISIITGRDLTLDCRK